MELKGIHHVTAITSSAERIYTFFTEVLGMRLVKKTVNQDDIQAYHLFFADDRGNPGTDITFFDFPGIHKGIQGRDSIARTSFRVPSSESLDFWSKRLDHFEVDRDPIDTDGGIPHLRFRDFDGQQYQLVSDAGDRGVPAGTPWGKGPVPLEHAIRGLGPVLLVAHPSNALRSVLQSVFNMREFEIGGRRHRFEMGSGGNGGSILVEDNPDLPESIQGYGTVHHLALRVADVRELEAWMDRLNQFQMMNSGRIDRFYFQSVYVRVTPRILFELATDGPGFMVDEPYETLGEKLSLPPFLESRREDIEEKIRPLDTIRSTRIFDKKGP